MKNIKNLSSALILVLLVSLSAGCSNTKTIETSSPEKAEVYKRTEVITSADEALKLLADGNKRFVSGNQASKDISNERKTTLASKGQHPFAIILSCSDSRVPPEIIFDQALGDVFVVRDAGNVIDSLILGSIEYGAEHLQAPLIIVLGHENCGAVAATVDGGETLGSIGSIVDKIKPSLEKVKAANSNITKNLLYSKTEDENINNSIEEINKSEIIKKLEEEKKIKVMGAKYIINTGEVTFTTT